MTTSAITPSVPVVGLATKAALTLSESGTNQLRVWVSDAPEGSALKAKLNASGASRIQITSELTRVGNTFTWNLTPDIGGVYVLKAQEYAKNEFSGGFESDPDGFRTETAVGSEATMNVSVAERMVAEISMDRFTADFVVYALGTKIYATTEATHGEKSPKLISTTQDPRVQTAILASSIQTALADLDNTVAATALGTLATVFHNIVSEFNDHNGFGSIHDIDDTYNEIDSDLYYQPSTEKALVDATNELIKKLGGHMSNSDATGVGAGAWHATADQQNRLLVTSCSDLLTATVALADCWRAFEAHRVMGPNIHDPADTTNVLDPLPDLLDVYRLLSVELVKLTTTAPSTVNSAAMTLMLGAGFKKKER